jgi:hypothetical protein
MQQKGFSEPDTALEVSLVSEEMDMHKKILFGGSKGAIQQRMMMRSLLPTTLVGSDDECWMCGSG